MDESIVAQSSYVRSYMLKTAGLYLSLMADGGIYVWARETGASLQATWLQRRRTADPRNWEVFSALNLREQPSTSARILATFRPARSSTTSAARAPRAGPGATCSRSAEDPAGFVAADYLAARNLAGWQCRDGPDDSSLRAGQGLFDATGPLSCAFAADQPMGQCEFGVARAGGGYGHGRD